MRHLVETLDSWPCKQSADFVRICLFTGMRKSEVMKLTWECVDLDRKTITIRDPKGGITTTIPISDAAAAVFHNIDRISNYVIPGVNGGMKKSFRNPWYCIRTKAGLPEKYRLHGLRHNFASQLVSSGTDLYTVSKLLTHKDVRTSERYAHLSNEALRMAAQKSGELLTPKQGQVLKIVKS
jgi:integrase